VKPYPYHYDDDSTEDLILSLEAGAIVLRQSALVEFPTLLLAAARRLENMQVELNAANKEIIDIMENEGLG
jgi:hypothetical protein